MIGPFRAGCDETVVNITGEDHGSMAYYVRQGAEPALSLPFRDRPVRFAVMRKDGLSSNAWRVWVEAAGDAYVLCRGHMKGMKAGIHHRVW